MIVKTYLLSFISLFSFLQQEPEILGFYNLQTQEDAHTMASFSILLNEDKSYSYEIVDDGCPALYVNSGFWKYDKGVLTLESNKTAYYDYTISDNGQINIGEKEIGWESCPSSNRFTILRLYYFKGNLCKKANAKNACYRKIEPKSK